jgi:hypothetical protein
VPDTVLQKWPRSSANVIARRQARAHSAITQTSTSGKDRSGHRFIPGSSRPDRVLRGITPGAGHPGTVVARRSQVPDLRASRALTAGRRAPGVTPRIARLGHWVCAVRGSQGFVTRSATVGSELACAGTVRSAARCSFSSGTSAAALEPTRDGFQGRLTEGIRCGARDPRNAGPTGEGRSLVGSGRQG